MNLNQFIDVASRFSPTRQQASLQQDGEAKTRFALEMLKRMPQGPPPEEEPVRIPSLGALAIPN